jgi:DNA-binding transcriptional regulator YiaG
MPNTKRPRRSWDSEEVRALRRHMGLTQDALAEELGIRQQTVSEWETGRYRPRGASASLLSMVAERAGFEYVAQSREPSALESQHREHGRR